MENKNLVPVQMVSRPIEFSTLSLNTRYRFAYRVTTTAEGNILTIPCLVLVGKAHKPRLTCVAGVHGNEHEGIAALYEVWKELDVNFLNGSVVLVPIANPPAFKSCMRRNPEDQIDMNRIFPGRSDGNTTEQISYHLFQGILLGSDLVLSMHGWTGDAMTVPYTEYPANTSVTEISRVAAIAFGLEYIEEFEWLDGQIGSVCNRAGIPAIEPEIGGLGCTVPERRTLYKQGMYNLLKHLNILPGKPEIPAKVKHVKRAMLYAPVGGVLHQLIDLGKPVSVGDRIAVISDLWGELISEITSPISGFVAIQKLTACVNPGELVAVVFQPIDK